MAYKFQLGAFTASGSIKAEEGFDADGQEASNFATISNGGSDITIAENAEVLGNLRISGSSALELGDNNHAIKNLANNLEFQVGGNTKLEIQSSQMDAKAPIRMSGSTALEFSDNNHAIKNQTGTNLEFVVGGQTRLEVQSSQIDAKLKIQMSGTQPIEFGSSNNKIVSQTGDNLELFANNTKVLELRNTQVDVERHLSVAGGQEIRISGSSNLKLHAPDANTLSVEAGAGKAVRIERSGGGFVKVDDQVELSGSGGRLITSNDGITIEGGLQVDGTLTYVNTTNLQVTDANIVLGQGASGSIDNIGLTFGSAGGVQTLQTQDSSGTQKLASSLPLSASTYYGDGSNLTGVSATGITETVQTFSVSSNVSASAGTIVLAQSASAPYTLTLEPAADSDGKLFKIKREDGQNVTIDTAAGNIDGASSIVLESEYAAVSVFSNGSNYFVV